VIYDIGFKKGFDCVLIKPSVVFFYIYNLVHLPHELQINMIDAQICTIFIQILYLLFESYFCHVAADKLVNLPTKIVASSVERC